jgi:hypothetical protein
MMHVMESDASGHPLEDGGELEIRAARNRGGGVVPALVLLPIRSLELVLHEEEPDPCRDGEIVGRQVDEKDARSE